MTLSSRFSSNPPKNAPDCWGEGYDGHDDVCQDQCGYSGSCRIRFWKTYGRDEDDEDETPRRVSIVRRSGSKGRQVSSTAKRILESRRQDHPIISDEEQDEVPLVRKVVLNAILGSAQASMDETYDLLTRRLKKIPKF